MARDYETEAMDKFLLPNQPDKGNFTSRLAYEAAMKVYQCDHTHVLEVHEQWKQGEWLEDTHCVAEAARARAATEKEHRGGEEGSMKGCHLEEEEGEASMCAEH